MTMRARIIAVSAALPVLLVPVWAAAQEVVTVPPGPTIDVVSEVTAAVSAGMDGEWWAMMSGLIMAIVWAARTAMQRYPRLHGRVFRKGGFGAPLFTYAISFFTTFAPQIADGPPGLDDFKVAAAAGAGAVAGWHVVAKRIVIPLGKWVWKRVRGWVG